jgi:hypothetical protein
VFESSATVCRSSGGVCDVAENCTGSGAACPADAKVSSGTVCRSSAGVCDVAEACDGSSDACPADVKESSGPSAARRRASCDVAEACDGSTDDCPTDVFESSATVCRSAGGRVRRGGELHGIVGRLSVRCEGELRHGLPLVGGRL